MMAWRASSPCWRTLLLGTVRRSALRHSSSTSGGSDAATSSERVTQLINAHGRELFMPTPAKYAALSRGAFDRNEAVSLVAVGVLTSAALFYVTMPAGAKQHGKSLAHDGKDTAVAPVNKQVVHAVEDVTPPGDGNSGVAATIADSADAVAPAETIASSDAEVVNESTPIIASTDVVNSSLSSETIVNQPVPASPAVPPPVHQLITSRYVLVGGGTATYSAMKTITEKEPGADILIIAAEPHAPYMRPPLSKELWTSGGLSADPPLKFRDWAGAERDIFYQPVGDYRVIDQTMPVEAVNALGPGAPKLFLGQTAAQLDVEAQVVTLAPSGHKVKYSKLLLATGGTPRTLPVVSQAVATDSSLADKLTTFRTIGDYLELDDKLKATASDSQQVQQHVVVVGGGFLGSELSCALARRGGDTSALKVTQLFPEGGNMAKVLPEYLSQWTTAQVEKEGVSVKANTTIESVAKVGDKLQLTLADGDVVTADQVVLAVGIDPNVQLARNAGLEIDPNNSGIVVNAELEARSNLFVAGDACSYHDVVLGRRRVEHHDHAILSGRTAGKNMMGGHKVYKHQSMFWSDLGPNVGYEAVGVLDPSLKTIGVWAKATENDTPAAATAANPSRTVDPSAAATPTEPAAEPQLAPTNGPEYGKGVVFYLRDDIVVGVLLWNLFHRTAVARSVISARSQIKDIPEAARMFNLHQKD